MTSHPSDSHSAKEGQEGRDKQYRDKKGGEDAKYLFVKRELNVDSSKDGKMARHAFTE